MPNSNPEIRRVQARIAILSRHRPPNDPERLEAEKRYHELMLEDHRGCVVGGGILSEWLIGLLSQASPQPPLYLSARQSLASSLSIGRGFVPIKIGLRRSELLDG